MRAQSVECRLGKLLAVTQLRFGVFPIGDVPGQTRDPENFTGRVPDRESTVLNPTERSVLPDDPVFQMIGSRVFLRTLLFNKTFPILLVDGLNPLGRGIDQRSAGACPQAFISR